MPRAKRVCPKPGCPNAVDKRYCTEHQREYEKSRGTKAERGYGKEFQAERRRLTPKVEAGLVSCARCGQLIHPGTQWALDHDDNDRSRLLGASHKQCNDSAGGKQAQRYR